MKQPKDPFKNLVLDEEEQQIEESIKRGEYVQAPNFKKTKAMLEEAAREYLRKKK